MKRATDLNPKCGDASATTADRQLAWASVHPHIVAELTSLGVQPPLTQHALDNVLAEVASRWVPHLAQYVSMDPVLDGPDLGQLAELAHRQRYARPAEFIGFSGVSVAGYGESDIFPSYQLLYVHGHVGDELFVSGRKGESVTHGRGSLIVPLAQKSMIDLFTDGFGFSLWSIIETASQEALRGFAADLEAQGVALAAVDHAELASTRHREFMEKWTRKNWQENYDPLMGVLTSLSVEEMAHLAETLLLLQSLKERVTSASEEVGGPIDVAVITKSDGLVWLKRKHFFDAGMNLRYVTRLQRSLKV